MRRCWWWRGLVGAAGAAVVAGLAWAVVLEARTSELQAGLLARFARGMTFAVEDGPNPGLRFPGADAGPYDRRLGYALVPAFTDALAAEGFAVERQARWSPGLDAFVARGGFAPYLEKTQAGLTLLDRGGVALLDAGFPERVYDGFDDIPPLVVDTLLFIEDRELLDFERPARNPAVEWDRLAAAVAGRIARRLDVEADAAGGSTLATQIEKYRHSPGGRTADPREKLRQMASAAVRTYVDGTDTREARKGIVAAYLSSTPLAARPGFGEVNGLGDGLWAWYGTDFALANRVLRREAPEGDAEALALRARLYRQVLSLLLAQRRPVFYLLADRGALAALTDSYLRLLEKAGVIDAGLAAAALAAEARFAERAPPPAEGSFVERKAASAVRRHLLSMLPVANPYQLDRLDLTVETTLDLPTQRRVAGLLRRLGEPGAAAELGLTGHRLLGPGDDPGRVAYSVALYERGDDGANRVRVQADNLDRPLDLNEGAKLELGSTAKLRALITYLEVMADVHRRNAGVSAAELRALARDAPDALTRWAAGHLADARDRGLAALLDAAMARRYSADPGARFFTAGGLHRFANFDDADDHRSFTVAEALRHSVNLVFIRLMRDVVEHFVARGRPDFRALLDDRSHPGRAAYLARFADREGREFLDGFFNDYRGLDADAALGRLADRVRRPTPERLAVAFRSVRPEAGPDVLAAFLGARLPGAKLTPAAVERLHARYGPDRYPLADRAYLARVHPLELWLVGWLQAVPAGERSRGAMIEAGAAARQDAYAWLFRTRDKGAQDLRIRTLLEEDAFARIAESWRRLGYPFEGLVPSYATAIGSSADRPAALAELVGIVLNDGVRLPTVRIERLRFAEGTPYETVLGRERHPGERVMAPEVAAAVRRALADVVERGTARRAAGAFAGRDGAALVVGGKTGTGDNRQKRFADGGRLVSSRVVNRTATFVFFIGDRFFGVVTAHVAGPEAEGYGFTSSLPVQLVKALAPVFQPLIDGAEPRVAEAGSTGTAKGAAGDA